MKNKLINIFIVLLFLAGLVFVLYPSANAFMSIQKSKKVIVQFQEMAEKIAVLDKAISKESSAVSYNGLYEDMLTYNEEIYENGQTNLMDPFSYEVPAFELNNYGLEGNVVGYIEIPRMDVELPIYLGATQENLAMGAGNLGYTSTPIGGINTNTVLAAHRGYGSTPMFRDIEFLQLGDKIYITNLWETMTYEVVDTKVILPTDIHEVIIQEGRDLVTLVTCHPYTQNDQRYIVYCERRYIDSEINEEKIDSGLELKYIFSINEMPASQKIIFAEKWLPIGILALLFILMAIKICTRIRTRKLE